MMTPHRPRPSSRLALSACLALLLANATPATAGTGTEQFEMEGARIILHLHDFLTSEELDTLRIVGTVPQALMLFMGSAEGHAAIAVAPDEGFIRDGAPVESAAALAELPDARAAATAAREQCDRQRTTVQPCVVVLEIAPQ